MEGNTMPSQRLTCRILSEQKFKVDSHKEKDSETNLWSKGVKVVNLHLKYNGDESSSDDEFIESAYTGRIENKNEHLDQKESDLCLEDSSCKKTPSESNHGNIDEAFDNDVMKPCAIKKETNDVNEIEAEELNYSHQNSIKSEIIEHEEIHIKYEEDNEDGLRSKKTAKPRKTTILHQCPECLYKTTNKYHFERHSIRHKKPDEIEWYKCQKCPHKTSRKGDLKIHAEIHNNLPLKCLKCSYETFRSSELQKHQKEHKSNIQWLHCPECPFKTHLQSYFQRHSLVHRRDFFKCTNCSYQAKTKSQLTVHQVKHESMDNWHSCPLCPFKSYAKKIFKAHCRRRHSCDPDNLKQIEMFKCTECPYENGYIHNVKRHLMIHKGRSWFQCSDCAYKTPYKIIFEKHKVRHQGENSEGWHRCSECSYKTAHKQTLQCHLMTHKSADKIQWFECTKCSFKTTYKDYLKIHELKHRKPNEIEWFYCYECGFKTKRKSYLVRHISKHKK